MNKPRKSSRELKNGAEMPYDLWNPEPGRKSGLKPPDPERLALLSNPEALMALKAEVDKRLAILVRPYRRPLRLFELSRKGLPF